MHVADASPSRDPRTRKREGLGAVGFSPINHHPPTQINEVVGGKRRKQGAAASVLELIA